MKRFIPFFVLVFSITGIIFAADSDHYKFMVYTSDKRKVSIETTTFKHIINEEKETEDFDVYLKIEYPQKLIKDVIRTRKDHKLSTEGYDNFQYTIERRLYTKYDFLKTKFCLLAKIDYSKTGQVLDSHEYSKQKWVDVPQDMRNDDFFFYYNIDIYANEMSLKE